MRHAGWTLCALLTASGLYLALEALRLPKPVLAALAPLLLLCAGAALALHGWRWTRRARLGAVAREADTRGDLKDEVRSAYWFARQDATSAWEAQMLRRAAQTVSRLDLRALFPFRVGASLAAAALLSALVLALALTGRDLRQPSDPAAASVDAPDGRSRPSAAGDEVDAWFHFDSRAQAAAADPAHKAGVSWIGAEAPAQSRSDAQQAPVAQRATPAQEVRRVPDELLGAAEQAVPGSPAARGMLAQAAQVSAEVVQGVLQRLQSLFGERSEPKPQATQAGEQGEPNSPMPRDGQQEAQHRDTEPHTTMDALNEALRALSQAATGDSPMPNSAPGDGSQNNARGNISGGAMGVRVNTTEAGAGGEDTSPDAPSEGLGEPALGRPTPRLAAQLQQLAASVSPAEASSGSEGFYVATQAQAARLDLTAAPSPRRSASEAALAREQVPVAYRASVKRYFLIEHGKEH